MFKFLKKSESEEELNKAQEEFNKGNYKEAFNFIKLGLIKDSSYKNLYKLAIECFSKLNYEEEGKLFINAINNFKNFEPFYNLGYYFIEVKVFELARAFLERAIELNPNSVNTAFELSLAYTARFDFKKAIETLEKVNYNDDFWAEYKLNECKLLTNQKDGVKNFIEKGKKYFQSLEMNDDISYIIFKINELEQMMKRLELLTNPETHIKDWHFVQYGASILDFFNTEKNDYVAGGRYVALWSSLGSIRLVLEKLRLYLTKLNKIPNKIIYINDRNSEIIAKALSIMINKKNEEINKNNIIEPNILIISSDNEKFNDLDELDEITNAQTIFSFNLNWLEPSRYVPDIAGILTQFNSFEWEGGGIKVLEDGTSEKTEPDNRTIEEITRDLVNTEFKLEDDFDNILKFYKNNEKYLKGGEEDNLKRSSFAVDSPIPGAFFC